MILSAPARGPVTRRACRRPAAVVGCRAATAWLLGLSVLLLGACGYTARAHGGTLPPGAEQVFVPPLENHTTDGELGAWVAAGLRRELARRGADGGPSSAARIEGEVTDSGFGASTVSGTYRASLRVRARLVVNGATVSEAVVAPGEDLLAGQDPLESEGRRRLALRRAADAAARELLDRFLQR